MTRLTASLVLLVVGLTMPSGAGRAAPPADPVRARLIAEKSSITPGGTSWVDLHLDIAPGWHIYWRNPGDSGLPTEIAWDLPEGYSAGEIAWPVPERFVVGTIGNYGYSGSADLLVPISVTPAAHSGATARLTANATWLVCSDICIPGEASLALDLPVSTAPAAAADPLVADLFAAVRARLPQPAPFDTRFAVTEHNIRLFVPASATAGATLRDAAFFPYDANLVDAAAAPRVEPRADGIDLVLVRASGPNAAPLPETISGVLALPGENGSERVYAISAPVRLVPGSASPDDSADLLWWQALLLAALGGALLNLMPCVFPVLSIKVLGLAGSTERAERWHHGAAYGAGVILSFVLLGGIMLTLRAGGTAIGWGFQLQSPVVVALLAYLFFAMGLSLSGLAEFGSGMAGLGNRLAGQAGLAGAFATGMLATIVATPCTAPFMSAALGFALIAPTSLALGIFAALGAGLALPMVLLTSIPWAARRLPRPGAWMVWLKQLLAFPLYGTVAWLIWVLFREVTPVDTFVALLGLVVVGFAVWIYGRTRSSEAVGRRIGTGLSAGAIAVALLLAVNFATAGPPPATAASQLDSLGYERFSTSRLERLVAEGRPVFVNLTAAWCITCLINEHTVLATDAVRRAFADRGVVVLKGDWTRQDPAITELLRQFGRSGVPLYLLYDKAGTPTVLPQILTEATLLDAVGRL